MTARIDPARTFYHRGCRARRCRPKLTNLFFSCGAQACDPIEETGRLSTFMNDPVNVSKSSLRLAWPSRAVATALLLLPAEQPASEQDVPVLVYGVQAGAARAGVGPVAHPGRAVRLRENRVSDAVCGRARSRALADHQSPRNPRCVGSQSC